MWSLDDGNHLKMAKIGLKVDWWVNCAKTHLVGSHLVKADVGVPCSWVNAVVAKVLTHILWCRLWQQSIDTFPETQGEQWSWLLHTMISDPNSLNLGISPISDDVSRWDPRDIMQARKTLLLPHKHAAFCIQVEKCFTTVTYPAVCSKITVQGEK